MGGFTEKGLKLEASVAGTMASLLPAAGPVGAGIATAIGGVAFVMEVLSWMENDTTVPDALRHIGKQIDGIIFVLNMLDARMDELVDQMAIETNRQTNRDLLDYLDEIRVLHLALGSPSQDVESAVRNANAAGITVDKFLRNDLDIWRWTDVIAKETMNPQSGSVHVVTSLATKRFKHLPTLPVYLMGLLTWLAAREKVVRLNSRSRLDDDAGRIARHLAAVSVRPGFDKYTSGDNGTPRSIAEHIKWHIRALAVANSKYPVNRICHWQFELQNWMNGEVKRGDPFSLTMASNHVLCTVDPQRLGSPSLEIDAETECGLEALRIVADTLEHVASKGTLRKPYIGQFPTTTVYPPAVLYVIANNGDLNWYRNESAAKPGGSKEWRGPVKVGNGWADFLTVFSGGGQAIYAIRPDGKLMWYGHEGYFEGKNNWRGKPVQVGHGWQSFVSVFSGGEYVVYGIQPSGDLIWYRHDGVSYGGDVTTWAPSVKVGNGWNRYTSVFSGGSGVIYAIREDGVLERHVHTGYLKGRNEWEASKEIGTGWNGFQSVVAAADGVLYAFTRDGRVMWYRYGERKQPENGGWDWKKVKAIKFKEPIQNSTIDTHTIHKDNWRHIQLPDSIDKTVDGRSMMEWERQFLELGRNPLITDMVALTWEGPVEVMRGLPGFRSVFPLMNAPFRGPN